MAHRAPRTAFQGPGNSADTPAPGQDIGSFFLTDDGVLNVGDLTVPPLIVRYASPTAAASGVILDIDFGEQFVIEARDVFDNVLETVTLAAGDPGTGDGVATFWSFQRPQSDVFSIRFVGTRTLAGGFGLGFDNFNATSIIPEPSTALLVGLGVAGLAAMRRRKLTRP